MIAAARDGIAEDHLGNAGEATAHGVRTNAVNVGLAVRHTNVATVRGAKGQVEAEGNMITATSANVVNRLRPCQTWA
jgi:hypothetical protein